MADNMIQPDPTSEPHFNDDVHPRHSSSGQFVPRADVHQAMQRIHDGRQAARTTLPAPQEMKHPHP